MSKAVGFFKNIILTNKGKELLLSSNNNIDNSLEFTICKFGDGRYTEEEALTATDIKNAWKTQNLNTVRIDNSEDVPKLIIEITFSNKDMQEPKVLNELGIFAKDKQNETHLFAYSLSNIENGEEIEIENDYPTTFKISIISKISNNTNVTNIIDPNGFLTKEVIELLKENIRNIAFRKIKGTLNAGERTITVSTDNLMPLSERLVLNIEGEIYFLDRDYTIDTKSNTITLKEPYSFAKDSMYEIIDPLPATYVKEQINEFIEDFKQLVSNYKVDFNEFKEQLKLEIQNKIDEFYNNLDSYIEQNRENLKGLSIKEIIANGTDINGGNKYNVIREDNTIIGEIIAPKGIQGNGVSNVEFVRIDENGDTEYRLVLDNGSKTSTFIAPRGAKGDPFRIVKVYRSILEMQADLNNPEIHVGDMVAIDTGSVEDEDTGKLFVRTNEEFSYLLDLSGATGIQGPEGPKGRDGKDGLSIKEVVPNGTDENGDNKYNIVREDNTVIGEIVSPAYGKDKVSKSGDTMTGTLIIESQEDHKLIIKSTSDNKENYILGRDASGNSLFYVGKGSISNNDISMYNYRNNKGIALTDLGVVFTGEPYAGNYRVYHEGYKPTASAIGAFNYIRMLTEVPKTFNGVTQVPNNSPDYTNLAGGGSQHFILQATTDDTSDNAYVGQIAWGYSADDPKIAIRCKNPSKNGQWKPLLRYKDVFGQTGHISGHTYMTDVFQSSYIHAFPASGERDPKALYIRTGSLNDMKNFKFSEFGTFELNNSIFTTAHTFIKNTSNGFSLYGDTNNFGFLDNNNSWLFRVDKTTNKAYIRDKEININSENETKNIFQYGTSTFMRGKGPIFDGWIELSPVQKYIPVESYPHLDDVLEKTSKRKIFNFGNLTSNNDLKLTITPLTTGGTITNPELIYKLFTGGLSYGEEIVFEITEPLNPNLQLGFELSGELWEQFKSVNAENIIFTELWGKAESGLPRTEGSMKTIQPAPETFFGVPVVDKWNIWDEVEANRLGNLYKLGTFRFMKGKVINGVFDICKHTKDGADYVKRLTFTEGSRIDFGYGSSVPSYVIPKKLDLPTREIMYIGKPSGEEN